MTGHRGPVTDSAWSWMLVELQLRQDRARTNPGRDETGGGGALAGIRLSTVDGVANLPAVNYKALDYNWRRYAMPHGSASRLEPPIYARRGLLMSVAKDQQHLGAAEGNQRPHVLLLYATWVAERFDMSYGRRRRQIACFVIKTHNFKERM
jgi:hypothetical protein